MTSQKSTLILKIKDLVKLDPGNKGLSKLTLKIKGLARNLPQKREAQLLAAPSGLIFFYSFSLAGWMNSDALARAFEMWEFRGGGVDKDLLRSARHDIKGCVPHSSQKRA
ncbi:MAG: hypothetical protein WAM66_02485 [Acidobacteriaceae bacterium]